MLRKAQRLDVVKERLTKICAKTDCAFRGKILRRKGRGKAQSAEKHQHPAHLIDIGLVGGWNAIVDYRSDDKGHEELEHRFYYLEKRRAESLDALAAEIFKKIFQIAFSS